MNVAKQTFSALDQHMWDPDDGRKALALIGTHKEQIMSKTLCAVVGRQRKHANIDTSSKYYRYAKYNKEVYDAAMQATSG